MLKRRQDDNYVCKCTENGSVRYELEVEGKR